MSEENNDPTTGATKPQPGGSPGPEAGAESASAVKLDSFDKDAAQTASDGEKTGPEQTADKVEIDEPVDDPGALQARIAKLEADLAAKEDQRLRALAEAENIRRRGDRERRDAEQFGGAKLARDMLPVFDNLDEALRQASDSLKENEAGFFNGVELTRKVLLDALAKNQITPIVPEKGEKFDPNLHQAMYEAPAPDAQPGTVINVMQSGFMIVDRLLRPAMVGVANSASGTAVKDGSDGAGGGGENQAASA